jgi:peptidoglycan hydrolase-like protein with peptidoglycan-binding domain
MAAFTSIGPIGVRQMNSNLYVGQNDLTTIQAAVTAAAQMGGVFTVYIPPEYAGTDSPTAVTGGNSSIYLMDERNGQRQSYLWYNGAFVKEPILAAGVATPQLNHYIYVGIEGQWPTIQSAVDNAVSGGLGDFVIITTSYSGSENIGSLTGGAANVFIVDERTAQRQVYEWNGTNYIPSDFEPLGAIRANLITANDLSVTDASFDTATVADSPVRTFANTPDGPGQGMVWPPEGIPVSLGSTWQMPSIDPDDLATWPAAGIAVST